VTYVQRREPLLLHVMNPTRQGS